MKIVHISDLHFGTEEVAVTEKLIHAINSIGASLIVVSGDFTQRAKRSEFIRAHDFIEKLNAPSFCVPGNHDIPPVNLMRRFTDPYRRYRRYISDTLEPIWENEKAVIVGLNSARSVLPHWNWANGALSKAQCNRLGDLLDPSDPRWRICTFHHPIHKVEDMPLDVTVFGHKRAIKEIAALNVDIVLTGHVHHASVTMKGDETHQTVYLSASTALSSRLRGQENGFNVITLEENSMRIDIHKLISGTFSVTDTLTHRRLA